MKSPRVLSGFLIALMVTSVQAADVGVTDTSIKVGTSTNVSGKSPEIAQSYQLGIRTYFERVNRSGGVHGRKIEYIVQDDGYEPAKAVTNVTQLIDQQNVFALVGLFGTPVVKSVLYAIKDKPVPIFAPYTGASFTRTPVTKTVFNVKASYDEETKALVNHAVNNLKVKEIAIIYQNDALGQAGVDSMKAALKAHGLSVLISASYNRNTLDVGDALEKVKKAKPKALAIFAQSKPVELIVKQSIDSGFSPAFLLPSSNINASLATAVGKSQAQLYLTTTQPLLSDTSKKIIADFQQDMKEANVSNVSTTHLDGYIVGAAFVAGLQKAGKDLSRAGLISALEGMKDFDLGGYKVSYSPTDHNGSTHVDLVTLQNGQFVIVKP